MILDIIAAIITYAAVAAGAWFIGGYMFKVYRGERVWLSRIIRPVEVFSYKLIGVDEEHEQGWIAYLVSILAVTFVSIAFTYLVLRFQDHLPLNPQNLPAVPPTLAFNTAVSFASNTNWQNYAGETTMSYFSQIVALVLHQFLSAAMGMSVAIVVIRAIARRTMSTLGNFWVDMVRGILYILLPISAVLALVLVANGAIQNFSNYSVVHTLTNGLQTIAQGPVASMEAIKDLGTNGGGFFNANAAHPFENPNGFTNALEIFSCLLIPFGLTITFGRWVGKVKQGIVLGAVMGVILVSAFGVVAWQEQQGNPALVTTGASQVSTATSAGGNMEGKEARFGPIQSALYNTATTGTSTGSVDASMDSLTPIGGLVPLVLIKLGEITPGDVGSGLYGMVVFAILAVFIAGLMVGRTPEYLGKKIEARDVKFAAIAILILPASILGFSAIAVLTAGGQAGPVATQGTPHMLTEILYAFASTTGNNGSAFAGLSGNTTYYNMMLAGAMWAGRYLFLIPVMAMAGNLVKKKIVPASSGTFPTDGLLFVALLIGTILIVAALTFFPAVSIGPILEHFKLIAAV
ncbi:MAG TPA: potassium-transporting ATPase subunit KdpA [Candidatus Dormibacteraeota bacterium]|jgi:K+-transporting ATPase ATPase A chain|nr:potassium-transporting ATPase subunit KdpA [Candidatus Dormibacteraeota bacterium]